MLNAEPRGGEGSAVCARGGDTSSRRWLRCWLQVTHHSLSKVGTAYDAPRGQKKVERHDGIAFELVHRLDVPVPQMVEQLAHVPTVVSYSSLQQLTPEQIADIPVPGWDGGGARGGLQGFPPGQNSAALHVEQTVDIPVPGRAGEGRRGGLQGFAGQGSTASSSRVGAADGAGQGGFRTFPRKKKSAKQGPHSGSELGADFNPSTLSAHQMPPEQLVDVPVPQVHERTSYEQETRFLLKGLHRRWEAEEAARLALLEEQEMDEDEEEEEVEVSRFLPHFRLRRWCWYVHAGSICPRGWDCTFAHHESELHPDSW